MSVDQDNFKDNVNVFSTVIALSPRRERNLEVNLQHPENKNGWKH
jgi:hypothetical protein